jgi:TPR repeat protein
MKILILFILVINLYSVSFDDASGYYKDKNYTKAFLAFKQLSEAGNINAQYNLAIMYDKGIGIQVNKEISLIWLVKAAKANHKLAQNKLGYIYEKGDIPHIKNMRKALKEYYKSAIQDYDMAQLNLGMYFANSLKKGHFQQAIFWYKKAIENENIAAMNNLANIYYFGQGTKRDYKKAVQLYTRAAKLGDKLAQYNLSMIYYSGEYLQSNGDKAYFWLQKSATQGYNIAQIKLANFYKDGDNSLVNKDYRKALYWYFKAAKQNYAPAQYYVGYFYFYGFAVKKDIKIATYWLIKSKNNHYPYAKSFMDRNKIRY